MNAAIRAITRKAIHEGFSVYGIERGFEGIINNEIRPLHARDVGGIITTGGTILRTARYPEGQLKGIEQLKKHGIEGVVVIGGDGSQAGAESLMRLGQSTITIPCTIDNDMNGTQYTIGFDTAINTVVDAVGRIRDTSNSHERVAIIEVMGRHAGHIALQSGLASGAELVLVPEYSMPLDEVCEHINKTHQLGKEYSIILVAEGAYESGEVKEYIKNHTYFDPSLTVLGYLQRGGAPSALDAILAARMSELAIDCLVQNIDNCITGYIDGQIRAIPYEKAKHMRFGIDKQQYELISILSH